MKNLKRLQYQIAAISFCLFISSSISAQTSSAIKVKKETAKEIQQNNQTSLSPTLVEPKKSKEQSQKNTSKKSDNNAVVSKKSLKVNKIK